MGEIADMHVEAFAAGLDPDEMDGADWADFYDTHANDEPPSSEEIAASFRCFAVQDIAQAAQSGETFVDTIKRLWPDVTTAQATHLQAFLETIGGFPEGD